MKSVVLAVALNTAPLAPVAPINFRGPLMPVLPVLSRSALPPETSTPPGMLAAETPMGELASTVAQLRDVKIDRSGEQWILGERFDGSARWKRYDSGDKSVWVSRAESEDGIALYEYSGKERPHGDAIAGSMATFSLKNGRLTSNITTKNSTILNAKAEFQAALDYFGAGVEGIKGSWTFGDNLAEFNRLTALGFSPEEAALGTWTGKRAAEAGFTKVVFSPQILERLKTQKPGEYSAMAALFVRP